MHSLRTINSHPLCSDDAGTLLTTTAVTIADGESDYVYPKNQSQVQRCGVFAAQLKVTCDSALVGTMQAEVLLDDDDDGVFGADAAWSPADNDETTVAITTSGAPAGEIVSAKRLPVIICGKKFRIKITNNSGDPLTIDDGILNCW